MAHPTTSAQFLRPRKAAEQCGVSISTIYRWIDRGLLRRHKQDHMTFIEAEQLRQVITKEKDQE